MISVRAEPLRPPAQVLAIAVESEISRGGSGCGGVSGRTELDTWQERLAELDVAYTPITDTGRGGLALNFRDPDGIALEVFHRPQDPQDAT